MKYENYPLWTDEGMNYLVAIGKLDSNGKENIIMLKEIFDDVADISKKDDKDIYCSESTINLNGAEYNCIEDNKDKNWEVDDTAYHHIKNEEDEKALLESGYWEKTEDSRLNNEVLKGMEVTPEKVSDVLPSSFHKRNISKDDMHLLFFEVQVVKDDNDEIKSTRLAPNPRFIDYLECFQVNTITQARINETNKDLRKNLTEDGIYATNINDYRNLGYTNKLIRDFRNKGLDILGVSEKRDNTPEQHQAYLKLGTALANFAFEYANNEGIVHKLNSDPKKMYNAYGKQSSRQKGEEYVLETAEKNPNVLVKNTILSTRYARVSKDFKNPSLALYTIDKELVTQIRQQNLMKSLFAFDKRFEKNKNFEIKDIIRTRKNVNKKWELANGIGIIGENTQKILNNMQNIEYKYDTDSYKLISAMCKDGFKKDILKLMGHIDTNSEEYRSSSFKKKEGIEGKNAVCEASLDNYLKHYTDKPFKLKGKLQRTMRYMLTGRINGDEASINPQSDKFQRFLIVPEKQLQSTFKEDRQDDVMGVVKSLGFSLGMKVENMSNREILEGFNEKFSKITGNKQPFVLVKDSKDGNSVDIKLNKEYIGTEDFRKNEWRTLTYKVLKGQTDIGEVGSVFKNLTALHSLSENMQKTIATKEPQEYKNISFLGEIDGTNNGIAFKLSMMPMHQDKDVLAKCGILNKELYTQMGDYKGRDNGIGGKNTDFYQSFSVNFDNVCSEKNPEFLKAFQGLTSTDPMDKSRRDYFKKVVVPAGYGGIVSPIRTFNEKALEIYEEKQAKRAYELSKGLDDTDKTLKTLKEGFEDSKNFLTLMGIDTTTDSGKKYASNLNMSCLGVTGGGRLGDEYNENKFYYLKLDENNNLTGIEKYDNTTHNILNKDVSKLEGCVGLVNNTKSIAQDLVIDTLNKTLPDLVPLAKAELAVGQLQCKMFKDFEKSLNLNIDAKNYDYNNKVFKDTNTELGGLTYQEGMQKIARNVLPSSTYGDVTIPAVKPQISAIYDCKDVGQELCIKQNIKAKIKTGTMESKRIVIDETLVESGAAASVFKIHPLDADVARNTVADMGYSVPQIYDAFVVNHQQMQKVGETYNKHFFNNIIKENPIEQAVENFDKAVNFIDKVSKEYKIPLNTELSKLVLDHKLNKDNEELLCVKDLKKYNEQIKENKKILYANPAEYICEQMAGGSLKVESINELKARQERIKKAQKDNEKEVKMYEKKAEKDVQQVVEVVKNTVKKRSKKNEID